MLFLPNQPKEKRRAALSATLFFATATAAAAALIFGGTAKAAHAQNTTRPPTQKTAPAKAKAPKLPTYLKAVSATIAPARARVGEKATLTVTVEVAPGFHINANKPGDENLIPTVLMPNAKTTGKGASFSAVKYPEAEVLIAPYSPTPINVYGGRIEITVPFTVTRQARPGKMPVMVDLRVQGCNETACFPPASIPVSAELIVNGVR